MAREARPLVFLGTPTAAASVLSTLIAHGFEIVHVVTRADARRGRGAGTTPSPVKQVALDNAIDVSHDMSWLAENSHSELLGVVVAYGRIIPGAILAHTPMVNVHFSLLPRWRGAAPVERAILAGDAQTGVCIMDVEETLDTGAVFAQREIDIVDTHTTETLTADLAILGGQLLVENLSAGLSLGVPQHGEATYAAKVKTEELRIDWKDSSVQVLRQVRALRSFTVLGSQRLKIITAEATESDVSLSVGQCDESGRVGTGNGAVRLVAVQPEGKAVMDASAWLRGRSASEIIQFS
ncbi:MAG: methionyl-tRNA formyltransferase [Actinobacteria bacterium]|uniref:methionyl-tRNA formyltransferase n=1 Tax=freshwater metagenome TaxID=449393 RepID=A0A6J7TV09_9ZZZZ|nr:methionyl-tRNA formyltransferase [Actinomycetota bacterium]MSZ80974.1 methionyl-tRNA formyltransferase [Actinomycetota bacterium]MTB13318.1 methionyl-tRNA formyltransferase [Actinomycetota bacterium]